MVHRIWLGKFWILKSSKLIHLESDRSQTFRQHCKANDLIIAVPEKYGRHILGRTFFNRNMLQAPFKEDVSPDILTNHVRYSSEIERTFKNAKMITIVRDPVEQFVSSFEFFHHLGTELSQLK